MQAMSMSDSSVVTMWHWTLMALAVLVAAVAIAAWVLNSFGLAGLCWALYFAARWADVQYGRALARVWASMSN